MLSPSLAIPALVLSVAFFGFPGPALAQNTGWRSLWNGKNLDGWYLFLQKHGRNLDPDKILTIEGDVIHAYKEAAHGSEVVMGYLGTDASFSNYHLRMRYRWGKKQFKPRFTLKPDGGIYYHHVGEDAVWPDALQFQVELNSLGDLVTTGAIRADTSIDPKNRRDDWQQYLATPAGGIPFLTAGRGVTYTRRRENFEIDGWNTVEIVCKDDGAVHIVNGQVVNRASNIRRQNDKGEWQPLDGGRILLEFEATEIYYRDIELRTLQPAETLDSVIRKTVRPLERKQ